MPYNMDFRQASSGINEHREGRQSITEVLIDQDQGPAPSYYDHSAYISFSTAPPSYERQSRVTDLHNVDTGTTTLHLSDSNSSVIEHYPQARWNRPHSSSSKSTTTKPLLHKIGRLFRISTSRPPPFTVAQEGNQGQPRDVPTATTSSPTQPNKRPAMKDIIARYQAEQRLLIESGLIDPEAERRARQERLEREQRARWGAPGIGGGSMLMM